MAASIPGVRFIAMPGKDYLFWEMNPQQSTLRGGAAVLEWRSGIHAAHCMLTTTAIDSNLSARLTAPAGTLPASRDALGTARGLLRGRMGLPRPRRDGE
jgi:hypothetical protein